MSTSRRLRARAEIIDIFEACYFDATDPIFALTMFDSSIHFIRSACVDYGFESLAKLC